MKQRYSTASFREKSMEDASIGDLGISGSAGRLRSMGGEKVRKIRRPEDEVFSAAPSESPASGTLMISSSHSAFKAHLLEDDSKMDTIRITGLRDSDD